MITSASSGPATTSVGHRDDQTEHEGVARGWRAGCRSPSRARVRAAPARAGSDRPASAGMPTRINGLWVRRATSTTIGTRITTPISKNIGSPMMAAISAIAQGSPRSPTRPMIGSTIGSAPPESREQLARAWRRGDQQADAAERRPDSGRRSCPRVERRHLGDRRPAPPYRGSGPGTGGTCAQVMSSTTTVAMPSRAATTSWASPASDRAGGSFGAAERARCRSSRSPPAAAQARMPVGRSPPGSRRRSTTTPGSSSCERLEGRELAGSRDGGM